MIERDRGNIPTPCDTPRAPCGMKRIADFDEVRLEPFEQATPATWIQRQAVVESAGPGVTRNRGDAARFDMLRFSWHEDGMFPARIGGEPRMLRREIALHAATRRRIEQGRIDEVHAAHCVENGAVRKTRVLQQSSGLHCTFPAILCQAGCSRPAVTMTTSTHHESRAPLNNATRLFVTLGSLVAAAQAGAASIDAAKLEEQTRAVDAKVIEWRRDIHQHPELSNREVRTAKLVAEHLKKLGLEVRTGIAHTGVTGFLKGGLPGPTIALRADMDALPVTEKTDVPFKSVATGTYRKWQQYVTERKVSIFFFFFILESRIESSHVIMLVSSSPFPFAHQLFECYLFLCNI